MFCYLCIFLFYFSVAVEELIHADSASRGLNAIFRVSLGDAVTKVRPLALLASAQLTPLVALQCPIAICSKLEAIVAS